MKKPYLSQTERSAGALSTLCIVLGAIFGATWSALALGHGGELAAVLKDYQAAIGAAVAVCAAFIAWHNVSRQLAMNLLTREEDRIEEALPGLRQTSEFLSRLISTIELERPDGVIAALQHHHGLRPDIDSAVMIEMNMALASPTLKRRIADELHRLMNAAGYLAEKRHAQARNAEAIMVHSLSADPADREWKVKTAQNVIDELEKAIRQNEPRYRSALDTLKETLREIKAKIERFESLLPRIRTIVEERIEAAAS